MLETLWKQPLFTRFSFLRRLGFLKSKWRKEFLFCVYIWGTGSPQDKGFDSFIKSLPVTFFLYFFKFHLLGRPVFACQCEASCAAKSSSVEILISNSWKAIYHFNEHDFQLQRELLFSQTFKIGHGQENTWSIQWNLFFVLISCDTIWNHPFTVGHVTDELIIVQQGLVEWAFLSLYCSFINITSFEMQKEYCSQESEWGFC